MSIITQALKKAEREQQLAHGGTAWVPPASTEAKAPHRHGQALWIVVAAVFAVSFGAGLHAWLSGPAAQVNAPANAVRSMPTPQLRTTGPGQVPGPDGRPAHQVAKAVPNRRPVQLQRAGVTPIRPVTAAAARPPAAPGIAADHLSRGNALYREGEFSSALHMYQIALALSPHDVKVRNNLGITYIQLAMFDEAVTAFKEALRLDNSYSLAYYNLACLYGRTGDAENAVGYLRQAVALEPESRAWAIADSDFAPVRDAPAFRALVEP